MYRSSYDGMKSATSKGHVEISLMPSYFMNGQALLTGLFHTLHKMKSDTLQSFKQLTRIVSTLDATVSLFHFTLRVSTIWICLKHL
jgi:hypothetical protein